MAKGGEYERKIAKKLGLWWTGGERDDVFWRTSQSGGRATTRSKKGKTTFGQYGDLHATDPVGQPLIDFCVLELKRGYGNWSIIEAIDKLKNAKDKKIEKFLSQVEGDQVKAGARYFLLIAKRDRHESVIVMPERLYDKFAELSGSYALAFKDDWLMKFQKNRKKYVMLNFDKFLEWADKEIFNEE